MECESSPDAEPQVTLRVSRGVSLLAAAVSCGADREDRRPQPSAAGTVALTCARSAGCEDLRTAFFDYRACCTTKYACGYELSYGDDFVMVYPQIRDVLAALTIDDPEHKCVPEAATFASRPGTYDHRVELGDEPEQDILVAAQCESRAFTVFALPGCCMPDERCGISTDEIAGTFEVLLEGQPAPFAAPECVSAQELNALLRASKLSAFARFPPTRAHAELT